jgi:hypothetical protein
VPIGPSRVIARQAWLAGLAPGVLVMGPALDARRDWNLPPHVVESPASGRRVDPHALVIAALEAASAGHFVDPLALEPAYLRPSAAEEKWDQRRAAATPPMPGSSLP